MITYNKLRKNITVNFQDIRVKSYTVISFTFIVVAILTVFAIRPVVIKLSTEIGEYNDLYSKDQTIKTNLSNLAVAENTYNQDIVGNTSVLDDALPTTQETGPLFANIQAIAASHIVEIDIVKFDQQPNTSTANVFQIPQPYNTKVLYFELDGSGTNSDIAAFISDLEAYPRTFNTTLLDITGSVDKTTGKVSSRFTLEGYVYYL